MISFYKFARNNDLYSTITYRQGILSNDRAIMITFHFFSSAFFSSAFFHYYFIICYYYFFVLVVFDCLLIFFLDIVSLNL